MEMAALNRLVWGDQNIRCVPSVTMTADGQPIRVGYSQIHQLVYGRENRL
jgi:hypothetical protein